MAIKVVYASEEQLPVWDKVEEIVKKEDRSVSWLVNSLLKNYVEKAEEK